MSPETPESPAGDEIPTGMPGGDDRGEQEGPMGPEPEDASKNPEDLPGIVAPGEDPPSGG